VNGWFYAVFAELTFLMAMLSPCRSHDERIEVALMWIAAAGWSVAFEIARRA